MQRQITLTALVISFVLIVSGAVFYKYGRSYWVPVYYKITGKRTVEEVMAQYGNSARNRLKIHFDKAGVEYPADQLVLLATKEEKRLELWAVAAGGPVFVRAYPIQGLSGVTGPKLVEGDNQVPEGFYRITGLNPNSAFHLSLKLNYPNEFDRHNALVDGRASPGSNIFIHGKAASIGCLAMGDQAAEDLFVLVSDLGIDKVSIVIAPHDPRAAPLDSSGHPEWVRDLYSRIEDEFDQYRGNAGS